MESEIQINNTAGVCQIDIEGTIGVPEEWQFEEPDARVATYERFRDTLRRIAEIEAPEVVVNIRSTGGDVNDALLIHDALRQLPARVTTRCYGYTASAATIIAQAASEGCRLLSANALYLIHTAICSTEGNAAEIAGKIDLLHQTDARIAAVYASRSGRPAAEFEALMAENNGQRPLARTRGGRCGGTGRQSGRSCGAAGVLAGAEYRPGLGAFAGQYRSAARPGASRRPQRSPFRRGGAGSAQPFGCCGRRSPPAGRADLHAAARGPFLRRHGPLGQRTRLCRRRQAHAQLKIKN